MCHYFHLGSQNDAEPRWEKIRGTKEEFLCCAMCTFSGVCLTFVVVLLTQKGLIHTDN